MPNVLTSGTAQKAAGDTVRMPMDFGDTPQLCDGAAVTDDVLVLETNVADYTVTAAGLTVSGKQLDYAYQVSAVFAGGTAGQTYDCVFAITLDDADGTIVSRTGPLKVV